MKYPERLRQDLEIQYRTSPQGDEIWICDPVSRTVARLRPYEFERLQAALVTPCHHQAQDQVRLIEEAKKLGFLQFDQLTSAPNPPIDSTKTSLTTLWKNPLAIRLPGFSADSTAKHLARFSPWIFAPSALFFWLTLIAFSLMILLGNATDFWRSANSLGAFQARHWMLTCGVLASTKLIHELAHAAACRYAGARCREIGVMILCGIPTLYCDVSESWRIESARSRSGIMLAGVYVEAIIAAISIYYWKLTEWPFGKMLAVNIIVVCGASSVLFNLNPLMRYDGYYVVSDLLNLPNLRQRAASHWQRFLAGASPQRSGPTHAAALLVTEYRRGTSPDIGTRSIKAGFVAYHLASTSYRYFVFLGLIFWGYHIGSLIGIEPLARSVVIAVAVIATANFIIRWFQMLRGQGRWQMTRSKRRLSLALGIALLLLALGWTPFHKRIAIDGSIDFADSTTLYIPTTATIVQAFVGMGHTVKADEPLLQLEDPTLIIQKAYCQSEVQRLTEHRRLLIDHALDSPALLSQLPSVEAALESAKERLNELRQTIDNLVLTSPKSGIILALPPSDAPLPSAPRPNSSDQIKPHLSLRSSPNQIADKGMPWCRVGNPSNRKVTFTIEASERRNFAVGGRIRIHIPAVGPSTFETTIESITQCSTLRSTVPDSHQIKQATSASPDSRFLLACRIPDSVTADIPVGASVYGVAKGSKIQLFPWLLRTSLGIPQ